MPRETNVFRIAGKAWYCSTGRHNSPCRQKDRRAPTALGAVRRPSPTWLPRQAAFRPLWARVAAVATRRHHLRPFFCNPISGKSDSQLLQSVSRARHYPAAKHFTISCRCLASGRPPRRHGVVPYWQRGGAGMAVGHRGWEGRPSCQLAALAEKSGESVKLPGSKKNRPFSDYAYSAPCAEEGVTNGTSLSRGVGRGPRYHSTNSLILTFGGLGDNRHSRSASA